jgi:hypothetical protein
MVNRLTLVLIAVAFTYSKQVTAQATRTLYCAAPSGLSLRAEPNPNSQRIDLIPYGTALENRVNDYGWPETFNPGVIDGYESNWIKVTYKNNTGYVFEGYTLPYSPPAETDGDLLHYLHRILGKPAFRDSFPNTYVFDNGGEYGMNYRVLYTTGEIYLVAAMEEAWEFSLIDLNITFNQAYLWLFLVEEKLQDKMHTLPSIQYPAKDVHNDTLSIVHGQDLFKGTELEIERLAGYTKYVRIISQNGRITIIYGGHV